MSIQTTVVNQTGGLLGALFDSGNHGELPFELPSASVAKVVTGVVAVATDAAIYDLAWDGVAIHVTAPGSSSVGGIRDQLVTAWEANAYASAKATIAPVSTDSFTLTGVVAGDDGTVTHTATKITSSVTTAAQDNSVLGFGYAAFSTAEGVARSPVSSDTYAGFVGVAAHTHDFDPNDRPYASAPDGYTAGRVPSVGRMGRRWVAVDGTITIGSSTVHVYVSGPKRGKFTGGADGSLTADLTSHFPVRWHKASANGRAVLELNLP